MEFKVHRSIFVFIIILINTISQINAKQILCLLGVGSETAQKWNKVLLEELSGKGHDLTIITPSVWDLEEQTNIEFIHLENTHKFLNERYENNTQNSLEQSNWKLIVNWYDQYMATCRGNLESIGFSEALHLAIKVKRTFDMIIYDVSYGPGCLLHIAYLYGKIPIVGITSSTLTTEILNINGLNSDLSGSLDPYTLSDFETNMSYWKKIYNVALYGFDYVYRQWVVKSVIEGLWSHNRHAKHVNIPKHLNDIMPRFKLILANHHAILHTLTSLPANIIPVPGLHIKSQKSSKLSTNLFHFLQKSKSNIIVIDLELKQLSNNHVITLLNVIRKFTKYNFIWKTTGSKGIKKSKPSNLYIEQNLDKQQLLYNLKDIVRIEFIITTSDILSLQECLHYGVPMITVILQPEQRYLAQRVLEQGISIKLQLKDFTLNKLQEAFKQMLTDQYFVKRANLLKLSFTNQQNPSLDTAIWWIENLLENHYTNDYLFDVKENLGLFSRNSFDIILLFEILLLMCAINTILVCRQTIKNFKKLSKPKMKSSDKTKDKVKHLKKDKKEKSKTS